MWQVCLTQAPDAITGFVSICVKVTVAGLPLPATDRPFFIADVAMISLCSTL